mmetsp:Transcript_30454/g.61756  ORF Transcript_30454/g.61756 Transcript_30454/m.61756 type:complete len:108 (+) Transcript_30454:61-384(+)
MYINQGFPSQDDKWPAQEGQAEERSVWSSIMLNEGLLTLWAIVSGTVIVLNFSVMVVAALIHLTVAHKTGKEESDDDVGLYSRTNPDGVIRHSTQFLEYWSITHDRK